MKIIFLIFFIIFIVIPVLILLIYKLSGDLKIAKDKRFKFLSKIAIESFKNLEKKIAAKEKNIINKKIKVQTELKLIPKYEDFEEYRQAKKKVLDEINLRLELIEKEEVAKFLKKFPVLIYSQNISGYKLTNDSELVKMYELFCKNKFNKENFKFLENPDELTKFIKKVKLSKYRNHFKNAFDVVFVDNEKFYSDFINPFYFEKDENEYPL